MSKTILIAMALLLVAGFEAQAQQPYLRASVLSVGASVADGGGIVLQSTLGQIVVGPSLDNAYRVNAGFWYQAQPPVVVAVNQPPGAAQITDPPDGSSLVVGGTGGASPADPATPFTVAWTPAADPEGDPISYTWQLARDDAFTDLLLSRETGSTTRYETTLGVLAAVLDAAGLTLNNALTLRHRVVASDGQLATAGTAVRITFIRGTLTAAEDAVAEIPAHFDLHANYPNPFNPTTTIAYDLPQRAEVRLVVYDLFGRAVQTLVDAPQPAGRHRVAFEAGDLASGAYFYRLEAGSFSRTRQFILLK